MTGARGSRDRAGRGLRGRLWTPTIGSALTASLLASCLPPAKLEPAPIAAAETAPAHAQAPDRCRVLIGERDDVRRYSTRELRWGPAGVSEARREGLVVGDADRLYVVTVERQPWEPYEVYGDDEVRCEQNLVMLRKLPDGLAQPHIAAQPACTGISDGEPFAVESSLEIVSVLGPLLGWRERVDADDSERTSQLDYVTLDLDENRELDANVWLLEPTPSMLESAGRIGSSCERNDMPETTADIHGFAVRWSAPAGPRLLVGYRCCKARSCELDEPLPKVVDELATQLPDPDGLLHSPYGCGSIGLDGQLRTRDGVVVGRVELDPARVIGAVFLPADHPFELDW